VRIVGGQWRGRRLAVAAAGGLRPTPDRVRETLFNWLQPVIEGARCLDLFAGTGVLGFEALSRGAAEAVLVEADGQAVAGLRDNARRLGAGGAHIVQADVLSWLGGTPSAFHVVFLDPPYRRDLLAPCCACLEQGGWLAPGAYIYLEAEAELGVPVVPQGWSVVRSKRAGQVGYHLALRSGTA